MQKTILINAITLRSGGGKSVLTNFLKSIQAPSLKFIVCVRPNCGYETLELPNNVIIKTVPSYLNFTFFWHFHEYWVGLVIKASSPELVINFGNLPLPFYTKSPQWTYFHWPYAIYPESEIWNRMSQKDLLLRKYKIHLLKSRLKYSDTFIAQTQTAKERLKKIYNIKNIHIIPNSVSLDAFEERVSSRPEFNLPTNKKKLLCLSRYYPHKNLEIFIEVGKIIQKENLDIILITTLDAKQSKSTAELLQSIKNERLESVIVNIGSIEMKKVPQLYNEVDGLILPTLLESYSGTYIEALFYKKTIFTSDLDFARDVCENNAFYFNPLDKESIINTIKNAYEDEDALHQIGEKGYNYCKSLPSWNECSQKLASLIEKTLK